MKRYAWALPVLGLVVIQLVLASTVELAADEAYYVSWSKRLAWGYFDHPPAIAGWIRLSMEVLGQSELGVRALGILSVGLTLMALVLRGAEPEDRGLLCLLLVSTPLLVLGGLLATPDVPLIVAWAAALQLEKKESWVGTGLALGLAILSKATGWLLMPALILSSARRSPRGVMLACLVGCLVALPHVFWLASHDFVSLRYQAGRVGELEGLVGVLALIGGQWVMVGPVLFLAGALYWVRGENRDLRWWSSVLVVACVVLSAWRGRSEPNWLAPAWLGTLWALSESSGRMRRAAWVGGWTAASVTIVVLIHVVSPLWDLARDPVNRVHMGKALGESVEAWGVDVAVTRRYQEAAWIEFYGGVDATTLPGVGRLDQFDLWREELPESGVYVRELGIEMEPEASRFYADVSERGRVIARWKNRVIAGWEVYRVSSPR